MKTEGARHERTSWRAVVSTKDVVDALTFEPPPLRTRRLVEELMVLRREKRVGATRKGREGPRERTRLEPERSVARDFEGSARS
jgi:hypothetical protein